MTNFMPHGHCYFWQPEILWPMFAGEAMHVIAYFALAGMLFFMCTRDLGRVSSWMPPFFFLFGCFIFTCGMGHAVNLVTIWKPLYGFQAWWSVLSGLVSMLTLGITLYRRTAILEFLGAGESVLFKSKSFVKNADCQKCMDTLKRLDDGK